jgi:hypothetical protein
MGRTDQLGTIARMSDGIDRADAPLVVPTAQALRIWRRLGLELGEAAVFTDGHELADLVGLVATWHGALPVVRLTTDEAAATGEIETVPVGDAPAAVERLRALTTHAPGLAAVDLSGRGSTVAIILEALPRWGRLGFAGPTPEPFTTAFYTDIHRKGAVVSAIGALDSIFTDPRSWEVEVRNACRLLMNPARAAKLRACSARALAAAVVESGAGA